MRSSRLLLVLGLLVAAAAAAFAFILISQSTGTTNPQQVQVTPTPPDVEVLVARRDLPAGTIISDTSDLFKVVPIPAVDFEQGNYVHAEQASSITAKKLLTPLNQNDPLQVEQLGPLGLAEKIPAGRRAYPIKVNLLMGVGDLISEGDRIDVLVSFPLTVLYIRPGITTGADGSVQLQLKEDTTLDTTTKTVLQDIQVLRILRRPAAPPQPPAEGTPALQPTPAPGLDPDRSAVETLIPGEWILILSVTSQEAEVIKYSIDRGGILNLALRATGDREISTTTGVTFDIMVRDYGVPIPRPLDLLRTQLQEVEETPSIPTPAPTVTQ